MIWQRFVASQMAPVQYNTVSADIKGGNYISEPPVPPSFSFLKVYDDSKDNNQEEEKVGTGGRAELKLLELEPKQHLPSPSRYSEASLVKTLEEQGIGRRTYAPIVNTIYSGAM